MISVFKNTYLLINIAPFLLKVKYKSIFLYEKPAGLYGLTGERMNDGRKGKRGVNETCYVLAIRR